MALTDEQMKAIQHLADASAEAQASAALAATQTVLAEVLSLLLARGAVTKEDIAARLASAEQMAAQVKSITPLVAQHIAVMTLTLRHALGIADTTKN